MLIFSRLPHQPGHLGVQKNPPIFIKEIEEHRKILPGGLSVFILFAEKKNRFRNRNYLEKNATADFFRLRVIPPSAQHVILTPTVGRLNGHHE